MYSSRFFGSFSSFCVRSADFIKFTPLRQQWGGRYYHSYQYLIFRKINFRRQSFYHFSKINNEQKNIAILFYHIILMALFNFDKSDSIDRKCASDGSRRKFINSVWKNRRYQHPQVHTFYTLTHIRTYTIHTTIPFVSSVQTTTNLLWYLRRGDFNFFN